MALYKNSKLSVILVTITGCLLFLAGGCSQTATIALKFAEQDSTNYRMVTEAEDGVNFAGSLQDDPTFKNRSMHERVEMVFNQQIQSIDDKGNANAKITIEGLKYEKSKPALKFDSNSDSDKASPFAKLIGQSYMVTISPAGKVLKIADVEKARALIKGNTPACKTAARMLSEDIIQIRHGILGLPAIDKNQAQIGDQWSKTKTISLGKMGSKSYQKIYTLTELRNIKGHQVANVKMDAAVSKETGQQPGTNLLLKMFDNVETYTGELNMDISSGKVLNYSEKLDSEWIAVDPEFTPTEGKEPDSVQMFVRRYYNLEKVD